MKYTPKKRKSTKKAYKNKTFMKSREARWIRVLAELMETEGKVFVWRTRVGDELI